MKKLLTLGLFSILLSCNNMGNGELLNESESEIKQTETKASAKESSITEDEIFAEISHDLQGVGYGNEIEYAGRWKLLCHTPWLSDWGNACFETPLGNYNIHWEPMNYSGEFPSPAHPKYNPIIYSGSWGCRCQ